MLLLSASPGARGAQNVMTAALDRFPRLGGNIIAHFSLPKFHEHFDGISITDTHLAERFYEVLEKFIKSLKNSRAS